MAVNFADLVYEPGFDMFAVPVVVYPIVSQPGQPSYAARGIFDTRLLDIIAEDGSLISDQKTILDILEKEFTVLPVQGDRVDIPLDCNDVPVGLMEITDTATNAGGETTLNLKKVTA